MQFLTKYTDESLISTFISINQYKLLHVKALVRFKKKKGYIQLHKYVMFFLHTQFSEEQYKIIDALASLQGLWRPGREPTQGSVFLPRSA